jgi:ABC-type nitrate/sulfonate/bicarbonate transport system substrate-binding protein
MTLANVALSLRRYLSMTLVAVACTIAMICGPANAADPKVTIFSGIDEHWVPLQIAKAKGFFTAEGVDAEVTVFTTGATATEAFRAGRGDFISAGDLPSAAMWKTGNVIGVAPSSSDTEIFGIVGKKTSTLQEICAGAKWLQGWVQPANFYYIGILHPVA